MSLAEKQCSPCYGDLPELKQDEIDRLLSYLTGWRMVNGILQKRYVFGKAPTRYPKINDGLNLAKAFVDKVHELGESENHHATLSYGWGCDKEYTEDYGWVIVEWFTVKQFGKYKNSVQETDFILAARTDNL